MADDTLVNRVAKSGIITIDLENYLPEPSSMMALDVKQFLVQEMVLMEKKFRTDVGEFDFSVYKGKDVAVFCSNDALIPHWAYMLLTKELNDIAKEVHFCTPEELIKKRLLKKIGEISADTFKDAKVVIKGCGKTGIDAEAYVDITKKLVPVVKSMMYGEPCSTVPVYKRKN